MPVSWRKPTLWELGPELGIDLTVPWIDVTDNRHAGGAKTDGSAAADTAIQSAIAMASSSGGGVVFFPPGTYLINGLNFPELRAASNVILRGSGAHNTTLKKNANTDIMRVFTDNVTVRDMTLDGNSSGGFTGACINHNFGDNCNFLNLTIKNAQTCGIAEGGSNTLIEGCRFTGNTQQAVFVSPSISSSRDVKIIGNYFDGTGATGSKSPIHVFPGATFDANGLTVVGNTVIAPANAFGIEIQKGSGVSSKGWNVSNNVVRFSANSTVGAISFDTQGQGVCSGNTVDVNGFTSTYAIELVACTDIAVTGNTINGGTTLPIAIQLTAGGAMVGCTVTSNIINGLSSSATAGIEVQSPSASDTIRDCLIVGNRIEWGGAGTGISGIRLDATNATSRIDRVLISSNIVRGNNAATTRGILLNNGAAGVVDKCVVIGNCNTNVATAIAQAGDTNTLIPTGTNQS